MEKIKVMILDNSPAVSLEIEKLISDIDYIDLASNSDTLEGILKIIDIEFVNIILVSEDFLGDGYKVSEAITMEFHNRAVIVIENVLSEDNLHKALFSGAKDVLVMPLTTAKIADSIYRANEYVKLKNEVHRDVNIRVKRKSDLGRVFTVFSTKGGVGKTFIATNLAITLQKNTGKRVVLLDLDLDFGSAALALNIVPKFTITDVVDDIRNINPDVIENYLMTHQSGIKILPANLEPRLNEFINAEHVQLIIKTLQNSFDFVVIDMPGRFHDPINPAFVFADKLLMVTTPEVSTVRNVMASLIMLNDLNYPKSKIKILLNKSDNNGDIKVRDVEKTLNQMVFSTIDADYKKVISSLNQGIPYVIKNPRSSISKEFNSMVKKIQEDSVETNTQNKGR